MIFLAHGKKKSYISRIFRNGNTLKDKNQICMLNCYPNDCFEMS